MGNCTHIPLLSYSLDDSVALRAKLGSDLTLRKELT